MDVVAGQAAGMSIRLGLNGEDDIGTQMNRLRPLQNHYTQPFL